MKSIQPPKPPALNRVNTDPLAPARQNGGRTTHGGTTTPLSRTQLGRSQNDARWDHHAAVAHPTRSKPERRTAGPPRRCRAPNSVEARATHSATTMALWRTTPTELQQSDAQCDHYGAVADHPDRTTKQCTEELWFFSPTFRRSRGPTKDRSRCLQRLRCRR